MLRRAGRNGFASVVVLVLLVLVAHRNRCLRDHYLDPGGALSRVGSTLGDKSLQSTDWPATCRQHGFSSFNQPRKVFDLVLFSTELDWLEIRLHSHAPYVDYFVIVESPTTFTNQAKPLHLSENWERYKEFHHMMIYKVVEDPIISTRHCKPNS